jgi:3-oxoacyl-[acyl-carrier protein] reductase
MRLEGKVALVTGATHGIGTTILERLAQEGAAVVFTGRSADQGEALADRLRSEGRAVRFARGNVGQERDVEAAVAAAVEEFGTLTTVVNNAAATDLTGPGRPDNHVEEIDGATFEAVMRTGVFGVLWTSKHAIPHMKEAGGGAIINISAASSVRAIEGRPAYQASKGAINALTRQMAVDYGLFGIRSNAIIVGFTPTGGDVITRMVQNEAFISAVKRAIPSPRLGSPSDIASGCVYLASDEAEYVNGVLLPIDGGLTCKLGIPDTSALSAIAES